MRCQQRSVQSHTRCMRSLAKLSEYCARPMTELLLACLVAPLENEGMTSKSPQDKSISSHFFPSGGKTGAERATGQARAFSQRATLAVGAKRRGLTRLPRSVKSERESGMDLSMCGLSLLSFFLILHCVRRQFSSAGDRLRLLTPSETSSSSVTG